MLLPKKMSGTVYCRTPLVFAFLFSGSLAGLHGDFRCVQKKADGTTPIVRSGVFQSSLISPFLTPDEDLRAVDDCSRYGIRRYMHNLSCYWHFKAPAGNYIYIQFGVFKLDRDCTKDRVQIVSTGKTATGFKRMKLAMCGRKKNWHFWKVIPSNGLNITLETDGEYNCRGLSGFFHSFLPQGRGSTGDDRYYTDCYSTIANKTASAVPTGSSGQKETNGSARQDLSRLSQTPYDQYPLLKLQQRYPRDLQSTGSPGNGSTDDDDLPSIHDPHPVRCNPKKQSHWLRRQLGKSIEIQHLHQLLEQFQLVDVCNVERELCSQNGGHRRKDCQNLRKRCPKSRNRLNEYPGKQQVDDNRKERLAMSVTGGTGMVRGQQEDDHGFRVNDPYQSFEETAGEHKRAKRALWRAARVQRSPENPRNKPSMEPPGRKGQLRFHGVREHLPPHCRCRKQH